MAEKGISEYFQLLSWNIDGLDERDTIERTLGVCGFIKEHEPHVVYLQEVVPSTWCKIVSELGSNYVCFSHPHPPSYYPAILVKSDVGMEISSVGVQVFEFPTSCMERHLLILNVLFAGVDLQLMTSHLESMKEYGRERKVQLKAAFDMIRGCKPKTSIFGGDLNVRDHEVASVGLPEKAVDVWEACGSQGKEKYTWDVSENDNLHWTYPSKPKLRFDRVYLTPGDGRLKPESFTLVGKDRLPGCKRFPSDHWGLLMKFSIKKD